MLRFCDSADIASGDKTLKLKAGTCRGIHVRYSGTNEAAVSLLASECGSFLLNLAGRPKVNFSFAEIAKKNALEFGTMLQTSTAGATIDMNFYVRFDEDDDGNVVLLSSEDYVELSEVPDAKSTSCSVFIYGDYEDGNTLYIPKIWTRTETLSAEKPIFLPDTNLYRLLISEPSTAPSKIILARDGKMIWDVPYAVAEINTNRIYRIESGTQDAILLRLGNLWTVRGRKYELQMVSGSGTLTYTAISCEFLNDSGRPEPRQIDTAEIAPNNRVQYSGARNSIRITPGRFGLDAQRDNVANY